MIDESTERLISRLLDDELSSDDRARLDVTLAADPAARQLLAELRAQDEAASAALRSIVIRPAARRTAPAGGRILRIGGGLALAAAVALAAGLWLRRPAGQPDSMQPISAPTHLAVNSGAADSAEPTVWRPLRAEDIPPDVWGAPPARLAKSGGEFVEYVPEWQAHPQQLQRHNRRQVYGVANEAGDRIYLIEQNARQSKARLVSGEF